MLCPRCQYDFCWCCMGPYETGKHKTWYKFCPELPFSFCLNLIITILFVIFLPVLMIIVPLAITIHHVSYFEPVRKIRTRRPSTMCFKVLTWLLHLLILTPLAIVACLIASALVGAILLLPGYFYSIGLLGRMIVGGCRTKL